MSFLTTLILITLASGVLGSTCKYTKAKRHDGCNTLSQRCGITQAQLQNYNTKENFCTTILVGQYVCCSAGSLPNFAQRPPANGTRYAYTVKTGDEGNIETSDSGLHGYHLCDYSKSFSSLEAIQTAPGDLRADCIAIHTLMVLIEMLGAAYANYTNVNNGYDALFGYYVTYMKDLVPQVLQDDFIWNITDPESASGEFATIPPTGPGMQYFNCKLGDNGGTVPCTDIRSHVSIEGSTTDMILLNKTAYQGGLAKVGLSPDWVVFGDYQYTYSISSPRGGRTFGVSFTNAPVRNDSMVVPNPKDIVTTGIGSIPALHTAMKATLLDIMLGQWTGGSLTDPVQAYSVPVFTLMQTIEAMAQAKQLGIQEQQEEEDKLKNFIVLIVSAVLFFVPIIGEEAATAVGFATLARSVAIAGELGNSALAIYDTVNNPSSAVVNILGMLFGVGAITKVARDGAGLSKVAKIREGMSSGEIATLGTVFRENDDRLQALMKVCLR